MTEKTEFTIDRPITGEPSNDTRHTVPQLTGAEFLAEIDALLAIPGVKALVWDQYTPYFNDGDACEFGITEVRAVIGDEDLDNNNDYGYGLSTYDLKVFDRVSLKYTGFKTLPNGDSAEALHDALAATRTGAWEAVALENFGDHATVTATTDGFNVEFYEHD